MFKKGQFLRIWIIEIAILSFFMVSIPVHAQVNTGSSASTSSLKSSSSSNSASIAKQSSSATSTMDKAVSNAKITVKYVNQNNKEIATQKVLTGKVGAKYNVTGLQKTIKGYQLKTKRNVTGKYAAENAPVVFKYQGVKIRLSIRDIDNLGNNLNTGKNRNRSITGYYGNIYKIKTLKSGKETFISSSSVLTGLYPLKNQTITLRYTKTMNDIVIGSDKSITVSGIILGNLVNVIQTYPNGEKVAVIVGNDGVYRVGTAKNKYVISGFKQLKTVKRGRTVETISAKRTRTKITILPSGYVLIQRIGNGKNYQTDGSMTSPSGHVTSIMTTVKNGMKSEVSEEFGTSPTQVVQTWPNGDILTTLMINKHKLQVTLQNKAKKVLSTKVVTKSFGHGQIFKLGQNQYLVYRVGAQKTITTSLINGNQYKRQSFTTHGVAKVSQGKIALNSTAKQALKKENLQAFVKAISSSKSNSLQTKKLADKPKRGTKSSKGVLPATGESRLSAVFEIGLLSIMWMICLEIKFLS